MDSINDGIRFINRSIDAFTDYIKENAVQLFIIGALLYYLKNSWNQRQQQSQGYTLGQSTSTTPTHGTLKEASSSQNNNNNGTRSRDSHLLAVRERQQALANQRALEAAKLRKEKEDQERDRKNHVAKKKETGGDVLGGGGGATCSYSPMQPWTGNSSGYRPARRTTRRG